jgi:hypothetical protein
LARCEVLGILKDKFGRANVVCLPSDDPPVIESLKILAAAAKPPHSDFRYSAKSRTSAFVRRRDFFALYLSTTFVKVAALPLWK